jgi:hypothetical protein
MSTDSAAAASNATPINIELVAAVTDVWCNVLQNIALDTLLLLRLNRALNRAHSAVFLGQPRCTPPAAKLMHFADVDSPADACAMLGIDSWRPDSLPAAQSHALAVHSFGDDMTDAYSYIMGELRLTRTASKGIRILLPSFVNVNVDVLVAPVSFGNFLTTPQVVTAGKTFIRDDAQIVSIDHATLAVQRTPVNEPHFCESTLMVVENRMFLFRFGDTSTPSDDLGSVASAAQDPNLSINAIWQLHPTGAFSFVTPCPHGMRLLMPWRHFVVFVNDIMLGCTLHAFDTRKTGPDAIIETLWHDAEIRNVNISAYSHVFPIDHDTFVLMPYRGSGFPVVLVRMYLVHNRPLLRMTKVVVPWFSYVRPDDPRPDSRRPTVNGYKSVLRVGRRAVTEWAGPRCLSALVLEH